MTAKREPANRAVSVRARLFNIARQRGVEFQLVLSEYAIERLLYRLGQSPHSDSFVLKGATLLKLWSDQQRRATWDLDLLGQGESSIQGVVDVVREVCRSQGDDGIEFDADTINGEEIRADHKYDGVRVRLIGRLADARIPVQIDVGFGDAVVPRPKRAHYPTLLDHPAPSVLVYPREAVVAEKLEAMVSLGLTNGRMKDFYDVHQLASLLRFDGSAVVRAIRATFERRRTPLPSGAPAVLSSSFLDHVDRRTQWRAFLRRSRLDGPASATQLAADLRDFVLEPLSAAARGVDFDAVWPPGGPWSPNRDSGKRTSV